MLDLSSISDDVAHEVFAKVNDQITWEAEGLRGLKLLVQWLKLEC